MDTRIRELRRRRGMTLQQLADRVGTTPQTVQRLETANMTMSTDWLERFAAAFEVHPADLIAGGSKRAAALLGTLNRDGVLQPNADGGGGELVLDIPGTDLIAVKLQHALGPYQEDSILIANRLRGRDMANAHGCDCLVALDSGTVLLRRVVAGQDGSATLVPIVPGRDVLYDQHVPWLARLVLMARYL